MPNRRRAAIVSWWVMLLAVGALAAGARYVNEVTISEAEGYRIIKSNGIPDHETGDFPNPGNPNRIASQSYLFRVPMQPTPSGHRMSVGMNFFGVALNGVPFDPAAAEWFDRNPESGWQYEAMSGFLDLGMDDSHAHVQPNGAYHYHGAPTRFIELRNSARDMLLIGYSADGYPIYTQRGYSVATDPGSEVIELKPSYRVKSGKRGGGPGGEYDGRFVEDWEFVEGLGELDECNGRYGVTPEYPSGTYYYVITTAFPFVPRYWRGQPDSSFLKRGPGPQGSPGSAPPPGHRPPPGSPPGPGAGPPRHR